MLEQITDDELTTLFLEMDLENRTQIITMVNEESRKMLEEKLD